MPAIRLESVNDWRDYYITPGVYFWGNCELGPMVDIIRDKQDYDIMEVTESDEQMDEALTQLGVGAIVAILIIREVLTFLKTKRIVSKFMTATLVVTFYFAQKKNG